MEPHSNPLPQSVHAIAGTVAPAEAPGLPAGLREGAAGEGVVAMDDDGTGVGTGGGAESQAPTRSAVARNMAPHRRIIAAVGIGQP